MKQMEILIRDNSRESKEAEKILKENNIEHAQLFSTDERLPCLISHDHAYAFNGIGNIRLFVRNIKATK